MKVNRERFFDSIRYIREINSYPLVQLDFSEFSTKDFSDDIYDWSYTGLSNKDFILMVVTGDE
jgi:hypothetical protein